MTDPSGSSCIGIKVFLQAHLVLEESRGWSGKEFEVYWKFGKQAEFCATRAAAGMPHQKQQRIWS
jgi:hypothetical protein